MYRVYNSAIVVDGRGERVLNYRKTHLYHNPSFKFEKEAFSLGDRFEPLFTLKGKFILLETTIAGKINL